MRPCGCRIASYLTIGRDVGHGEGYHKAINWEQVKATLDQCYQDDLTARRAAGNLGASDPALAGWLSEQNVPADDPVWVLTARLDRLAEMDKKLTEMVADMDRLLKNPADRDNEDYQKQYDLASVFLLKVRTEQEELRQAVKNR